jgi:hypothetical protein
MPTTATGSSRLIYRGKTRIQPSSIAEILNFLNGASQKGLLALAKVVVPGRVGELALSSRLADQGLAVGSEDGRGSSARIEIDAARGWTP